MKLVVRLIHIFVLVSLAAVNVFANVGLTTYQAKIVKPDGYPLEASAVNFRFSVLNPIGNCIVYVENYAAINMTDSGGLVSFSLGSGLKSFPSSATTFADVFSNSIPALTCAAGGPATYSPGVSDTRKIVMQFQDSSGWQTLPAMNINAVPYAMYANNSRLLNGKTDLDFVEKNLIPSCSSGEALFYTGGSFSCVPVSSGTTSATVISALGYTPVPSTSFTTLSASVTASLAANDLLHYNGSEFVNKSLPTCAVNQYLTFDGTNYACGSDAGASGTITSVNVSGPLSATAGTNPVISLNYGSDLTAVGAQLNLALTGVIAGTYQKVIVDNKGRVTSGSPLTSSDVTTALGYAPVSAAALSSYVLRSNNLSDLTSSATARANLGIGYIGTLTNIDLGTSDATGTLAIARTPSYTGDVTKASASNTLILSNTGVVAGTYSKVTVDAKGRVTSASPLTSSDVTTALGFSPQVSGSTVSSQWVTSGSAISYNSGHVGIGVLDSAYSLYVSGTIASTNGINSRNPNNLAAGVSLGWYNDGSRDWPRVRYGGVGSGSTTGLLFLGSGDVTQMALKHNVGLGLSKLDPTARLDISAGTSSLAPLKLTSGTLLTSPQSGSIEYDGFNFYITDSSNTRRAIATNSANGSFDNTNLISNTSGNITLSPNNTTGSVIVSSTTVSTNSQTGSLIVKGGLGIAGNLFSSGSIVTTSNIEGVSVTATSGMISPYIAGSVASGGSLVLDSTAHATKGVIALAPLSGKVGIGTVAPTTALHISQSGSNIIGQVESTNSQAAYWITKTPAVSSGIYRAFVGASADGNHYAIGQWGATEHMLGLYVASGSTMIERMRITSSGAVGIGTNNPSAQLQVSASDTSTMLSIENKNSVSTRYPGISVLNYSGGTLGHPHLTMVNAAGSSDTPSPITGGRNLMALIGSGYDGTNFVQSGRITFSTEHTFSPGNNSTSIVFMPGRSGTYAEAMRITASGSVGIGTSTPSAKLQLVAGTTSIAPLKLSSGTLLSTPQSGTLEYDGFDFYITDGNNIRRTIATASTAGALDNVSVVSSTGNISLWPANGASVIVSSTTASTNSQTGSLVINGGLGLAGNLFSSGTIITSSNIQGVSVTATSGMISPYIAGSVASGGSLTLESTTHANKGNLILAPIGGGRVGIGTTAPLSLLNVEANQNNSAINVADAQLAMLRINNADNTAGSYSGIIMGARNSGVGTDGTYIRNIAVANDQSALAFGQFTNTSTSGSEYMRISPTGNVGIGTSSPASRLDVSDNSGRDIRFYPNGTAGFAGNPTIHMENRNVGADDWLMVHDEDKFHLASEALGSSVQFTVTSDSKVGINVSAPITALQVQIPTNTSERVFVSNTDTGANSVLTGYEAMSVRADGNTSFGARMALGYRRTDGSAIAANTRVGMVLFGGQHGTSNSYNAANVLYPASVQGLAESTWATSSTMATALIFTTGSSGQQGFAPNLQYGSERMRIDSSGRVGIGVTSPDEALVVRGSGNSTIKVNAFSGTSANLNLTSDIYSSIASPNSSLGINISGTERMRFSTNGNVGIGTGSPNTVLQVTGSGSALAGLTPQLQIGAPSAGADVGGSLIFSSSSAAHAGVGGYSNAGSQAGYLSLYTRAGAGNLLERMRLDSSGNVGIGTSAPVQSLHIHNPSSGTEGSPGIFIQDPTTTSAYGGSLYYEDRGGADAFKVSVIDNSVEKGFIAIDRSSGLVGIGTLSPTQALTVSGVVRSTAGGFQFPDGSIQTTSANAISAFGMAYATSGSTQAVTTTWTDVTLSGGSVNMTGATHSTSTNPARITVTSAGTYEVTFNITYLQAASGGTVCGRVRINGTATAMGSNSCMTNNPPSPFMASQSRSVQVALSAGAYVTLQVFSNNAGVFTLQSWSGFADDTPASLSIKRVGP